MKKLSLLLLSATVLISGLLLFSAQQPSRALSGSSWRASNIISDTVFYNNQSMSVQDIQNFLNSRVPNCDTQGTQSAADAGYPNLTHAQYAARQGWAGPPYICIKDYYQVPRSDQIINNYNTNASRPSGSISAAQIIKNAADTYHISPKVLLVTLQKESLNLLNDTWPTLNQYKNAMGYGCPDTAPCDASYAGFYNQMSNAARQFKLYRDNASSYRYKPLQNNSIYYSPNYSCGATNVYIENYATASLYNYTPYQPNKAALNNLYGTGDGCSAYGNRNFWRIYSDWFGSTQAEQTFISSKSHVSGTGWTGPTTNSGVTGTTGQSKNLEAFRIDGEVEYSSYSKETGWQPTVNQGMISGTTGQSRSIRAIKVNPIGSLAQNYDLYYRVHESKIGWMGWVKNGDPAGVTGSDVNDIEAIEFYLAPKNAPVPGVTNDGYRNNGVATYNPQLSLRLQSHVSYTGWQPTVTDDMTSGTTEQTKNIEAIAMAIDNKTGLSGNILYSTHVAYEGWQGWKNSGQIAGTTGQNKAVEAIRVRLTGQIANKYDIWYRGYVAYKGWQGWTKNDLAAGSIGASLGLEAVETRVVPKGTSLSNSTNGLYNQSNLKIPDSYNLTYAAHVSNVGWVDAVSQNDTAGTIGQSKPIEALSVKNLSSSIGNVSITCSGYIEGEGWVNGVVVGGTCGSTGKSKPLQAIKLSLSGSDANLYTISYRTHLSKIGWGEWTTSNDQVSGKLDTAANPIEAVQIRLIEK